MKFTNALFLAATLAGLTSQSLRGADNIYADGIAAAESRLIAQLSSPSALEEDIGLLDAAPFENATLGAIPDEPKTAVETPTPHATASIAPKSTESAVVAIEPVATVAPTKVEVAAAPAKTEPTVTVNPAASAKSTPSPREVTMATVTAEPKPSPSQNVTINLINRLVQSGALTRTDADELIKQAEEDAVTARTMAARQSPPSEETPSQLGAEPPPFSEPGPLAQTTAYAVNDAPISTGEGGVESEDDDSVSVSYVPDIVKRLLREEIRAEVMEQARNENWANPRIFPAWVLRLSPFADVRVRGEGIYFPDGNDNTGAFPNFNAINTGSPFDVTGNTFSPQLNVDTDRQRVRLRARFGAQMDLEDGFSIGLRIATGETNSPTSTNQSFGFASNGQGGNFSKYAIWLDRAFVKFELGGKPTEDFVALLGRFDNPFFAPSEIIWDDDLGFDGLAFQGKYKVATGITPFANVGAFPVFNTELNFSSNRPDKFSSNDKYLLGGQLGVNLRFNKDFSAKIAGAYYDFMDVEGRLSDPFVPLVSTDQGNTDGTRPAFAQKGNTYFPIRNITPTADNNFGTTRQFQYFGLATPFRVVDFSGSLDFAHFEPVHVILFGQWLHNTAFDYDAINAKAVNNRGPEPAAGVVGPFAGGSNGWIGGLKVGHAALEKRWQWNAGVSYRYVESDAVIDGFNDSDFGGGGTNVKGYTVFGSLALSPRVAIGLRWLSSDEIGGPPLRNDTVQFDFNAKF